MLSPLGEHLLELFLSFAFFPSLLNSLLYLLPENHSHHKEIDHIDNCHEGDRCPG